MAEIPVVPEDVTVLPLHGKRVRFDGTNADALQSLAGDRWRGVTGSDAFVLNEAGTLARIRPGWILAAFEAGDGPVLTVTHPELAARIWRAA